MSAEDRLWLKRQKIRKKEIRRDVFKGQVESFARILPTQEQIFEWKRGCTF